MFDITRFDAGWRCVRRIAAERDEVPVFQRYRHLLARTVSGNNEIFLRRIGRRCRHDTEGVDIALVHPRDTTIPTNSIMLVAGNYECEMHFVCFTISIRSGRTGY